MGTTTYTPKDLHREARRAVRGLGRYQGWQLRVGRYPALIVYYTEKGTGRTQTTSVAI